MGKRESFFSCVFASEKNEYQFHFRAGDAEDAEIHFRQALHGNGVGSRGELVIRNPRGEVVRRSLYEPVARGEGRSAEAGSR
ncbi:MAG TPA: hypothetical protein VFR85_10880 [Anaeromyxobacteraceae bacterium]|nr:hypothetical protein [Anaeromyxobacteraceae bacterium]